MHRTFIFARLVAHILSESCEYNHESHDFSIKFEGADFTLKIDEEVGIVATTTVPNVHTTPQEEVSDEVASMRAAVVEKLSAWTNRAKQPCKIFKEKNGDTSTKWNVCPFGDLGEVTDYKPTLCSN